MTSLLFTLTVIGLIALVVLIGKYNKSDNLTLILLMALLAGMAGGAIVNKLNSNDKKKNGLTQIMNSTQMPSAQSVDLFAVLNGTVDVEKISNPKSVMNELKISAFGSKSFAPSKRNGEIRAQPFNSYSVRGGPYMFFDTS